MIKSKKHEKLSDTNIQHVVELLSADKPITKKEACSILNISYNTTRLNNIIAEWQDTQDFRAKRKAMNRGKPATEGEIKAIAQMYIDGDNVSDIAKSLYRSPAFVRGVIDRVGIPMKLAQTDYEGRRSAMLPEQCVADSFDEGEIVWAIRQNYPAKVIKEQWADKAEERGYKLYLIYTIECTDLSDTFFPHLEYAGKYAVQPAYEIGSLRHLEKYGVKLF